MTTLQEQAWALGDLTRHGIFRHIAELTDRFGVNHNAIRQHVAKLVDAGLVIEDHAQSAGRGRPRLVYRLDPTVESRWGVVGPYERLSVLLAEVLRTGGDRIELVLHTCPFASAVLAELVPRDPRRAKCRLRMHLVPMECR